MEKKCPVCETGTHQPWSLGNKYCEKHDVCVSCGIPRKGLGYAPWGVRLGSFMCRPCEKTERESRIAERIAAGFEHDYEDEVVCPHCGYKHSDSWEMQEGEHDCPECEKSFHVRRHVEVTYSTSKKE